MIRREVEVIAALPRDAPAPELLHVIDDGNWIVLVFEPVDGRLPTTPWDRHELELVIAATIASRASSSEHHSRPSRSSSAHCSTGWRVLADESPGVVNDEWCRAHVDHARGLRVRLGEAAAGDGLVHGDVRSDNVLITATGDVVFVDWTSSCVGAPWFDLVCMLPSIELEGGGPPESVLELAGLGGVTGCGGAARRGRARGLLHRTRAVTRSTRAPDAARVPAGAGAGDQRMVATPLAARARGLIPSVRRPGAVRPIGKVVPRLEPMASSPVDSAKPFWPNHEHWSVEIPLDTPHPRLDVMRERGVVLLRDLATPVPAPRVPGPRVPGLEERRRHQLRSDRDRRRRARLPRVLEPGQRALRTRTRSSRATRSCARRSSSTWRTSARTSGGCARSSSSPRTTRRRSATSTATTTTASTPTTEGWVVRSWLELTDNPDSYMLLMESGADGLPDPATEIRVPAAPRLAVRRRHAAPVARRGAQRDRAPVRAHLARSRAGRHSTAGCTRSSRSGSPRQSASGASSSPTSRTTRSSSESTE